MSSLMETAKLNGLDPEAYLRRVLAVIADHPINLVIERLKLLALGPMWSTRSASSSASSDT